MPRSCTETLEAVLLIFTLIYIISCETVFRHSNIILTVCFSDITAREFIELRRGQRSRYDLLGDFLSEMLSVPPNDVNIFSLTDVKDRMLDVRFAVRVGSSFLQPEKMHGYLAAHKQKVGWVVQELKLTVVHIQGFK